MYRKIGAMFVFIVILSAAAVFGQTKTGQAAKKTEPQQAPSIHVIQGVLVDKAGAPMAGIRVYMFRLTQDNGPATLPGGVQAIRNSVSLSYKLDNDRKIVNPSAETDVMGRFVIKADIGFLRKWQIPTESLVAGTVENESARMLVRADGSPASFSLLAKTTIDLGTVQPEAKR